MYEECWGHHIGVAPLGSARGCASVAGSETGRVSLAPYLVRYSASHCDSLLCPASSCGYIVTQWLNGRFLSIIVTFRLGLLSDWKRQNEAGRENSRKYSRSDGYHTWWWRPKSVPTGFLQYQWWRHKCISTRSPPYWLKYIWRSPAFHFQLSDICARVTGRLRAAINDPDKTKQPSPVRILLRETSGAIG
jgi:hypothetical protein